MGVVKQVDVAPGEGTVLLSKNTRKMMHKKTIRVATARGYETDRCGAALRELVYFPNDYVGRKNTNKKRSELR